MTIISRTSRVKAQNRAKKDPHPRANLRRADWRFLLPLPPNNALSGSTRYQHLVLLGGPPMLGPRLVEVGCAARVSTELPCVRTRADAEVDAIALLHDAPLTVDDVLPCLQSGGVLYVEINRLHAQQWMMTPARLQQKLRQAGFSTPNRYWAAPNFDHCSRYLPLNVPRILDWYFAKLYVAGTPRHALIRRFIGAISRRGTAHFARVLPYYCVTAVATGADTDADTAHPPVGVLASAAQQNILPHADLHPVVLTSGFDEGSRAIVIPFDRRYDPHGRQYDNEQNDNDQNSQADKGRGEPTVVLKVATRADFNRNTEQEQRVLAAARDAVDPTLRPTIPQPLGLFHYDALVVGAERYAPGPALAVSSGRWRATLAQQTADLTCVARWITHFHQQTASPRILWDEAAILHWWDQTRAAYACAFMPTHTEQRLFHLARDYAQTLKGLSLPLVWVHDDLGPWNLYRDRRGPQHAATAFTVGDWEFGRQWPAERFGLPLCDLLYFVTYWLHVAQHIEGRAAELDQLHALFVARHVADPHIRAAWRAIEGYLAALEIDERFVPLLLLYLWMEQAVHQHGRKAALGTPPTNLRHSLGSVQYLNALAAHPEGLFAAYEQ